MEIGRTTEITCLTPSERYWIEQALAPAGKHPMAEAALQNAVGRQLLCNVKNDETGEECGAPATHFYMPNPNDSSKTFGTMRCTCTPHWRDLDPNDTLCLNDENEAAAASDGTQPPSAGDPAAS